MMALSAQISKKTFANYWSEGQVMTPQELMAAAKHVHNSEKADALASVSFTVPSSSHYSDVLTEREVDVLRLLATGLSNKLIAEKLTISPKTVNIHVSSIYKKLEITSRTAATRYAIANGFDS